MPRRMIPEGERRRTPVSKAIGMPELDVGGKLLPLQRPGSSDVLPEEEAPKLPTDGLILSPAELAGAVLDGRKTLMVKTRPFEIAGKRCLLIGDRKALGIVTVGKLRDVDLAELNRTVDQHHISEELRAGWAVDRKRWKKGPFYGWTIKVESKFDEPVETDIGPDPQVLARNVELKSVEKKIRPDPTRLFFCARLPDEIRKKLTDLAEELEGIDAAKLDDADHITVLYVPSKGEYSEGDKKAVFSAVQKVLDSTQPIDAKLQGWGYFDGVSKEGEPATALVALIDAPGLADLHVKIKAAISKAGFSEVDDQTHGYVPHATLAYLPVGARIENLPVLDAEFKIEKIELVHSDISEMDLRGVGKNLGDYEHALAGNQGKTEFYKMALQSAPERAGACAVEFFAGRGSSPISGVSGLKHIGVDKDESAVKAYKKKHPKAEVVCGDSVKMLPGGLLIDEDIAIADFDASGKPHDVIKAFFDSVQIGKPLLLTATWGFVNEVLRRSMTRKEAVDELTGYIKERAGASGAQSKLLGWSHSTANNRHVIYCAYSIVPQGRAHLGSSFPASDVALASMAKRVDLAPDLDVGAMTTAELNEAHWSLHALFRDPAEARTGAGFSVGDASNLHALVVDELFERKVQHPPPPGDGMDDVSEDFERYGEKQPDYDMPPWERMRKQNTVDLPVERVNPESEVKAQSERTEKQADPYMEYPDEDKAPYRYVVQHHHRGKSLHADLRIGYKPGKLLLGWTLNTQIAGEIKEPITTLKQAQQLAKTRVNQYSKIDWRTGEWAERPKHGATKLVRTSILCERKALAPWAWIDVEGKTKDPEPGKPPPVGGTKNFPGVFNIVDRGDVEFGSQKQQFHEYFFTEGSLKGRLIFRQLRILPAKKGTHSRSRCMHEGCKRAPDVDVLWADGRGRVWFCTEHLAAWKRGFRDRGEEDWLEIVGEKKVTSDEVPEKWSDVHKSENIVVGKELVLPPSEEQDLPGPAWLAIKPDDQTPYVLDGDAVKKNWMPPVGVSALPRAIREQVPEEYRYWQQQTAAKAKQARDALVLAIKARDIKIDYSAPYGREISKASMTDARFVLQEQTWRGPIQIRTGPSRTLWCLRLDVGRPELIAVEMYLNPLDNKRLAVDLKDDPHRESMKFQGPIKPSHYLNPTKTTPSNIEIMDSGKASVLAYSDKYLKVRLDGELLGGPYEASRSDGDWLWQPSEPDQKVEKEAGDMEDEYRAEFVTQASIAKVDKEKRLVTGIVLEPNTVDAQGDTIDVEAIERAAHRFLSRYNRETQLGVLHTIFGENGVELVESWTAKTDFKLGGQDVTEGTWLMTNKVVDDELWKKVKAGEITGFSIGGTATVI